MRTLLTPVAAVVTLMATPLFGVDTAQAQLRPGSVDLSLFGGYWEGDHTLDGAPTFGARAGYNFSRFLGLEANYGLVPTTLTTFEGADARSRTSTSEDVWVQQAALNAVLNLNWATVTPYLTGGVGLVHVDETYFSMNLGLGARYHITDLISLRADFRGWFGWDAPAEDEYAHFEATLGVTFQFGGDDDMDKDGIKNTEDKCPLEPETVNGYKDDDGCPEPDRDGDGIPDEIDQCPDEPEDFNGFEDEDGCPDGERDTDGDGIPDIRDKCPNEPEDFNGFEDEDGCPDGERDTDGDGVPDMRDKCPNEKGISELEGCAPVDTDGDGIPDHLDKCPNEPETFNGFEDEDGCPDVKVELVKVTDEKIEIMQKVFFDNGKASIQSRSFPVLDEVALVLGTYPKLKIRVEGHTDNVGNAKNNQKLSEKRAESVRAYLTGKGIDGDRLEAVGYGPSEPIDNNKTAAGRENNRRVEFKIVDK